ncbi:MAG: DUF5043 domain-containing protein [Mediterranea sp.]|nr:DUF5043 domain-containing protein [Mediterranea sp.]
MQSPYTTIPVITYRQIELKLKEKIKFKPNRHYIDLIEYWNGLCLILKLCSAAHV